MRKALSQFRFSLSSRHFIELEEKYGCHNYQPVPVVIARAKGYFTPKLQDYMYGTKKARSIWIYLLAIQLSTKDIVTRKFFRSSKTRLQTSLSLQERTQLFFSFSFYNNKLGEAERFMSNLFKYDKVLFMNSGAEAGESAIKLARRWAYNVKRIPDNNAWVLFA